MTISGREDWEIRGFVDNQIFEEMTRYLGSGASTIFSGNFIRDIRPLNSDVRGSSEEDISLPIFRLEDTAVKVHLLLSEQVS